MKTYLFIFLCLFVFTTTIQAQSDRNKDVLYFKGSTKTVKGVILSRDSSFVKVETEWGDVITYQLKDIEQIIERYAFSKEAKATQQVQATNSAQPEEKKNTTNQAEKNSDYSILGNLNVGLSLGGALPFGDFGEFFQFAVGGSLTVKQLYKNFGFHLSAGAYSFISKEAISIIQNPDAIDFDNPQEPILTTEKVMIQVVPITVGADYHYPILDILKPYAGVEVGLYQIGDVFTKPVQGESSVAQSMGYGLKAGVLFGNRTKLIVEGKYSSFFESGQVAAGNFASLNLGVLFQIGRK